MSDVVRGQWISRAMGLVAVVAVAGLCAATARGPAGLVAAALCAAVAIASLAATAALGRALQDGSLGDLMLRDGTRIPLQPLRTNWHADRAELVVVLIGMLVVSRGLLDDGLLPMLAMFGCLFALLWIVVVTAMRRNFRRLLEAQEALQRGDLNGVRRSIGPLLKVEGPQRDAAAKLEAYARVRDGDVAGGVAILDRMWSGSLDSTGADVAIRQIGRGDFALARRWLDAYDEPHRYGRYLRALVSGHLAVAEGRGDDAVEATSIPVDVPPFYARELAIARAAGHALAGRPAEAEAALATVTPPLHDEPWRAVVHPQVWEAAGGRAARAPSRPAPTPGRRDAAASPFAAPASAPERPRGGRRHVGMVPIDFVPVSRASNRSVILHLVLTVLLVALCLLLVPLVALLALAGDVEIVPVATLVVVLAAALVVTTGPRLAIELLGARGGPSVVRSDGSRVPLARFGVWSASTAAPGWLAALLIGVAPPFVEWGMAGSAWSALGCLPLGLLMAWLTQVRARTLQLILAAHTLPGPEAARIAARSLTGWGAPRTAARATLGLMELWQGDLDRAEEHFDSVSLSYPQVHGYAAWIRAGRGEVDLAQALTAPAAPSLPDAWRQAVMVGLAALHADRADAVADRLGEWDALVEQLPNRFGALLGLVASRVRAATGTPLPRGVDADGLDDLAALRAAWPFLDRHDGPASSTTGMEGSSR